MRAHEFSDELVCTTHSRLLKNRSQVGCVDHTVALSQLILFTDECYSVFRVPLLCHREIIRA
jgi:hypothetical protein